MTKWTPKNGGIPKAQPEPENEYVVGHISKGRSARFTKSVSYFLRPSNGNCCRTEVTGKGVNLGDEEGLQIPCILHFSGEVKFVSKLKDILLQLM